MLTYEMLRAIVIKEKSSNALVSLPEGFFELARDYLAKKEKMRSKEDSWELESAKRTLRDIIEIREGKIIKSALWYVRSGSEPENLTPEERAFFDSLVKVIKDWQERKSRLLEKKEEAKVLVSFKEPLEAFVGIDMNVYGPFKSGDIVYLPKENAELLIKKGIVQRFDDDSVMN